MDFIDELRKVYTPQDKNNSQKSINILSDSKTLNSISDQHGNIIRSTTVNMALNSTSNSDYLQSKESNIINIEIESEEITTIIPVSIAPIESHNSLKSFTESGVKSEFDSYSEVGDGNNDKIDEDFGEIIGSSITLSSSTKLKTKNKKSKKNKEKKKNEDDCKKNVELDNDDTPSTDIASTNQDGSADSLENSKTVSSSDIKKKNNESDGSGIFHDMESIKNSSGSILDTKSDNNNSETNGIIDSNINNDIKTKLDEKKLILPRKKKNKSIGSLANDDGKAKKRKKIENDDIDDIFGGM